MSDTNTIHKLIQSADGQLFSLRYTKKDGAESSGVFHAKTVNFTKGGEDSTKHIDFYINLYNVQKKRWSKIDMRKIKEAKINGQVYKFA